MFDFELIAKKLKLYFTFVIYAGISGEFRQELCSHKQVLKSSLCHMDQNPPVKLVFMYCDEARIVRLLIATTSNLLTGLTLPPYWHV